MRQLLVSGVIFFALAVPAGAALPVKAEFWNGSHVNGAAFFTSRHTVRELQFFCKHTRYDLERNVHIRRDGSFRFHGRMRKYGHSGEPLGVFKGRLHGRFRDRRHARIFRSLPDCGKATVTAVAGARS